MITLNNVYAMDDKMNLYKILKEDMCCSGDETCIRTIYQIAEKTFTYEQDVEEGEWITGEVAIWPVPTHAEYEEFLKNKDIFSVERLLRVHGIDRLKTNIIGFFCIGIQVENSGDFAPFAYKITHNGKVNEDDSFFKDFKVIANIQEIPKNMLQKLYNSFTQPTS